MKQEEKDLLLKDLCARLPYGVKIHAKYIDTDTNVEVEKVGVLSVVDNDAVIEFTCDDTNWYNYVTIHVVKPYLFPFSSMTEEQTEELVKLINTGQNNNNEFMRSLCRIEFYHKYHFDYRGLIPKGLAIDATNLNIY